MQEGLKIATQNAANGTQKAEGFCTPTQDRGCQKAYFMPRRVLPIVFLPGIMGSNLKIISKERQERLRQEHNRAWRPDYLKEHKSEAVEAIFAKPAERQLRLDPVTTEVDVYNPSESSEISGDGRHSNVQLGKGFSSPLLLDDLPTMQGRRSAVQKARSRGWGEVMFESYGELLQHLEARMNNTFSNGKMREEWRDVVGVDPTKWQAEAKVPQQPLTEDEFKKAVVECIFPVYAFGYNWLRSNGESAKTVAQRISTMIQEWVDQKYECEKVIIVTHSMGGLVARGVIHPKYGNIKDKVIGIVHGVMPATGAGATYRRMRGGFENPEKAISKILGNYGDEVTAVLANSPGGLQLLPCKAYGNGWLKVATKDEILGSWPKDGDPYEEIYKLKGKWYSLFKEEWINPSGLSAKERGGSFARTIEYLEQAKDFHNKIEETYHENSYAHYGVDPARPGWGNVVWEVSPLSVENIGYDSWNIETDNKQGSIMLTASTSSPLNKQSRGKLPKVGNFSFGVRIMSPVEPGDQTVPIRSSDAQLRSGKFKAIFRQKGYEHQDSYKNPEAIASTLYSIVRIAQQAQWKSKK